MKIKIAVLLLGCMSAHAAVVGNDVNPTELKIQSAARPFNLNILGPVYAGGSDTRSKEFQTSVLPGLLDFVNTNLSEYKNISEVASKSLDPSKLTMTTDSDVRVYFLGEGAGYHNTLGVNMSGTGLLSGNPALLFPDASTRQSYYNGINDSLRTKSEPLLPGDFVSLGTVKADTKLDFFLIADGVNSATKNRVWTANKGYNSDGLQHMLSYSLINSAYFLLSFEDQLGGGDKDFNDAIFVMELSNVKALANPEPHSAITFGLLAFTVVLVKRYRNKNTKDL